MFPVEQGTCAWIAEASARKTITSKNDLVDSGVFIAFRLIGGGQKIIEKFDKAAAAERA